LSKQKTTSVYDVIGNMTPEQVAAKTANVFQGETMTCVVCGCQQKSDPATESNWRAIHVNETIYYVCPNEFPPDGSSREEFSQAYLMIFKKIKEIKNVPVRSNQSQN
jgi:hypothetical protein